MDATLLESSVKDLGVSISNVPVILPLTLSSSNKLVQWHGLLNISNYVLDHVTPQAGFRRSYHFSSLQVLFSLSCILCSKDVLYHCHNNHLDHLLQRQNWNLKKCSHLPALKENHEVSFGSGCSRRPVLGYGSLWTNSLV